MQELRGNIWDYHTQGHWILVPTNGDINRYGACVMGRGIARDAALKFPALPYELGYWLRIANNYPRAFPNYRLISLPVKYHWGEKANLALIDRSLGKLVELVNFGKNAIQAPIYLPRLGCGNGRLDWESEVRPLLQKYLDPRFIVVYWGM